MPQSPNTPGRMRKRRLRRQFASIDEFSFTENDFGSYRDAIVHDWLHVLTMLGFTLVPVFLVLDYFMMPRDLMSQFAVYRGVSTALVLIQYLIVRKSGPGPLSYIHGYLVTINVAGIIALMTVDLGGFSSSYYAGLNLVIIGVNLLLPWKSIHSALNAAITVCLYLGLNLWRPHPFESRLLMNNLFFLCATGVIAVSINHVKYKLIRKEFQLLVQLKKARDALWSEMELAKRIQTALLPVRKEVSGYAVSARVRPAKEVGGDYYDIIETETGGRWLTIGDVSGHGVDSGLIMMMAQTSVMLMVRNNPTCGPSEVLSAVNTAIRENISRLGSDYYMTIVALRLDDREICHSGHHQDIYVYRKEQDSIERIQPTGTWLGILDDISPHLSDRSFPISSGDIVLLYTDGITEATSAEGEMFGEQRLIEAFHDATALPVSQIADKIMESAVGFQTEQHDDMTVVVLKRDGE